MHRLALSLAKNLKLPNKQLAFWAYDKGCSLNNAKACYRAAFVFKWNFEKDAITPAKARVYLRKSCALRYRKACIDLDEIWRFGDPY
ncbi:MAG: hypothetical protein LUC43_00635 [Burkholderiales bacterium]|nr:hypothetical protein [Burkholderiales bacterium]